MVRKSSNKRFRKSKINSTQTSPPHIVDTIAFTNIKSVKTKSEVTVANRQVSDDLTQRIRSVRLAISSDNMCMFRVMVRRTTVDLTETVFTSGVIQVGQSTRVLNFKIPKFPATNAELKVDLEAVGTFMLSGFATFSQSVTHTIPESS